MIIDPLSQMLDRFTHIKRSATALHQIDLPFCIAIRERTWSENLPIGKRVEGSLPIPGAHVTGSTCKNTFRHSIMAKDGNIVALG